jgi:hypothetical protein
MGHQSCLLECPTLLHIAQFGTIMIYVEVCGKKKIIGARLSKYLDFLKVGIAQSATC